MKKIVFAAFAVLVFWGCGDSNSLELYDTTRKPNEEVDGGGPPSVMSRHFITEYVVPHKLEAISYASGYLSLKLTGDVYKTYRDKSYVHYSKAEYFSELYGDNSFVGKVRTWSNSALAYPIEKITIWSDKDFDAEHPAGTPLDDIVALRLKTYYDFIKSGYKVYNDNAPNISSALKVRNVNFEDINADNSKLASIELAHNTLSPILFNSAPTELGEYPFTIEMTINGEVLKHSFNFTFE